MKSAKTADRRNVKIDGTEYRRDDYGVLIPADLFVREGGRFTRAEDAIPYLSAERAALQEHFLVLTLDGSHQVIKKHTITIGLADRSLVHPRETFRPAILDMAVCIIIAHNHPSGSLEPSANDLLTTKRLCDAGSLLRIPVLDHIILSRDGIRSIRESFPNYFTA